MQQKKSDFHRIISTYSSYPNKGSLAIPAYAYDNCHTISMRKQTQRNLKITVITSDRKLSINMHLNVNHISFPMYKF